MRSLVSTQQHVNTQPELGISLTCLVQVRRSFGAGLSVQRGHEDLCDFWSRVAQSTPPASGVWHDLHNQCSVSPSTAPGGLGILWNQGVGSESSLRASQSQARAKAQ